MSHDTRQSPLADRTTTAPIAAASHVAPPGEPSRPDMVWIPGGMFTHPAVHVEHIDAATFADWEGKALPSNIGLRCIIRP